jgi:hypothetical protein
VPYLEKAASYAKLVSDLISMGANIHAILYESVQPFPDVQRFDAYDPFLCFLRGLELDTKLIWDHASMAKAVAWWGQVLVAGGLNLMDYVAAENEFLASIECADLYLPSSGLVPVKLLVSEASVLTVKTTKVTTIWICKPEAIQIPGAWPRTSMLPGTISWIPCELDENDEYRWVCTERIVLKPRHNEIDAINATDTSSYSYEWIDTGEESRVNQDDHGLVARLFAQERRRRQRTSYTTSRRRAASTPPSLLLRNRDGSDGYRLVYRRIFLASDMWFTIHKCPFDSRWHRIAEDVLWSELWRYCMQGYCRKWEYDNESQYDLAFERWLLRDEANVQAAKRYVAKFCPEQMDIVDTTMLRVIERARSAIGPKE